MRSAGCRSAARASLVVMLALVIGAPAGSAHAYPGMSNAICHFFGGAWLVGSSLVNLGFTGYAIEQGLRTPPYPPRNVAQAQLGLMVPQLVLSTALVPTLGMGCENPKLAILYFGVPMAWSTALIGHGSWALHARNNAPTPILSSAPALTISMRVGRRY